MTDIVITNALRTAIGKFSGSLAKIPAPELGATVIRALLAQSGIKPEQISEVILGQVLTAGSGQNPARQASIKAGLPHSIPAMTINKVCGSGLKAVMLAAQAVQCGDADIVIAGGQENMSAAPHVLPGSRDGFRMGDAKLIDSMIVDGLWDVFNQYHMGTTAENVAKKYEVSRAENCGGLPTRRDFKTRPPSLCYRPSSLGTSAHSGRELEYPSAFAVGLAYATKLGNMLATGRPSLFPQNTTLGRSTYVVRACSTPSCMF